MRERVLTVVELLRIIRLRVVLVEDVRGNVGGLDVARHGGRRWVDAEGRVKA